jgi:hypothetical protein
LRVLEFSGDNDKTAIIWCKRHQRRYIAKEALLLLLDSLWALLRAIVTHNFTLPDRPQLAVVPARSAERLEDVAAELQRQGRTGEAAKAARVAEKLWREVKGAVANLEASRRGQDHFDRIPPRDY